MHVLSIVGFRIFPLLMLSCVLFACGGGSDYASINPMKMAIPAESAIPQTGSQTYFYYSSSHDPLDILMTVDAKKLLSKYAKVIAGVDAHGNTSSPEFLNRVKKLKANGFFLHVYLEGPGGPTGSSWSVDECERVHSAAKIYVATAVPTGDQCNDDSADWMKEWNEQGFFKQLQQQLTDLKGLGVESVEVDNLYRAGYGSSDRPLSDFISRFKNGQTADIPIKLLLKNIGSSTELDSILKISPRSAIADFMILEEDLKDQWCLLQKDGKKYGITTAFSWNTFDYHAESDSDGKDLGLSGPALIERKKFICN